MTSCMPASEWEVIFLVQLVFRLQIRRPMFLFVVVVFLVFFSLQSCSESQQCTDLPPFMSVNLVNLEFPISIFAVDMICFALLSYHHVATWGYAHVRSPLTIGRP
eukprot:scpid110845/ scgid32074/ 